MNNAVTQKLTVWIDMPGTYGKNELNEWLVSIYIHWVPQKKALENQLINGKLRLCYFKVYEVPFNKEIIDSLLGCPRKLVEKN